MDINAELRRLLKQDTRTSAELSRVTGIGAVSIRKFKAGMLDLKLDSLYRIAAALGHQITVKPVKQRA